MCVSRGGKLTPGVDRKATFHPPCDSQGGRTDWGCDLGAPSWGLRLDLVWSGLFVWVVTVFEIFSD